MGRAALDALAGGRGVCGDFRAQSRDMFAPTLRRGRRRRRAPRRSILFEPLASARSTIGTALRRVAGPLVLPRPAPASRPLAVRRLGRRRFRDDQRRVEIDTRFPGELRAQLVAQHARAHFRHFGLREIAEFERTEGDADQPVHLKTEVFEDFLDLPVFPFPETQCEPGVRALLAVEFGFDAEIVDAVDRDSVGKTIQRRLFDRSDARAPDNDAASRSMEARARARARRRWSEAAGLLC